MSKKTAIITDTVRLPSKGLLYNGEIPSTVTMRPMSVNELKMLYGSASTLTALNSVLREVITDTDINIEDMLLEDKYYLSYQLRILTFGEEYSTDLVCPYCKKQQKMSFNLSDLEVVDLPDDFSEPINIGRLPKSEDEIEIRLLRVRDSVHILQRVREILDKYPDFEGTPVLHLNLASSIARVNGSKKSSRDLEQYVLDMHALDAYYLQEHIAKIKFGLNPEVVCTCSNCGRDINMSIAIGEDFFRPSLGFIE